MAGIEDAEYREEKLLGMEWSDCFFKQLGGTHLACDNSGQLAGLSF